MIEVVETNRMLPLQGEFDWFNLAFNMMAGHRIEGTERCLRRIEGARLTFSGEETVDVQQVCDGPRSWTKPGACQ